MSLPQGNAIQLYRRFTYGDPTEFAMFDTRQYRTIQPCEDGFKPRCAAVQDPNATPSPDPPRKSGCSRGWARLKPAGTPSGSR